MQGISIQQRLLLWPATSTCLPIYFCKLLLSTSWRKELWKFTLLLDKGERLQGDPSKYLRTCFLFLLFILWNRSPHGRFLHELNPHLRSPPRASGVLHADSSLSSTPTRRHHRELPLTPPVWSSLSPAFSFLFHFSNIKKILEMESKKQNFLGFVRVEEY